jgi:hypothetical protein
MKKKLFFKLFIFAVIGTLVTFTSCKDYDDDISRIDTELSSLKSTALAQSDLTALQTQLQTSITAVQTDLNAAKAKLTALEGSAATEEKIADAKEEILGLVVKLETFNAFKEEVEDELATLKADLAKAATKEEVGALEELYDAEISEVKLELAAAIANIEAIQEVVDGNSEAITDIYAKLADQLEAIEANADEIAAVKADLQTKYNELSSEIATLKTNLANITSALADLDDKVDGIKLELDVKINGLTSRVNGIDNLIVNVFNSLDKRVTSLTFIPDYTSEDGTPQIVVRGITEWNYHKPAGITPDWYSPDFTSDWNENWAVKQLGTIYKGISILRYNVSPTNVKLTDFEIHQLLHKTSLLRYADTKSAPIALAGPATLDAGVLSVPVFVEESDYDLADDSWWGSQAYRSTNGKWGTNVSVALQIENINVAMDNQEARYVTSTEYVKANFDLSEGRIALTEKSLKTDGTILPVGIDYDVIPGSGYASDISLWNGKSFDGNTTDVLNHTINLNEYIYGVFDDYYGDWEKMTEFGFNTHTFKFRRVYLESEGVNQTNDYVTLNETTGVIGVKPAGQSVNAAAVGRTPIVEVTALVNGKVHAVGYIKIIITDNFDDNDVTFEFTLDDYVLGCNSTYELTDLDIAAIDFDRVFNHPRIQLGKDAFFQEYKQNPIVVTAITPPTPSTATVGYNDPSKHVSFKYAINPQTQSVNLYNYLEGNIRNDAPHGTYEVTTRLKSNGYRPDVVITWNFKVVLPTNLKLTPNEVFLSNGIYKVDPTVRRQTPTPKTSTPYEGLLQNAFLHNDLNLNYGILDDDQQCDDFLTPYFVFTEVPAGFTIVQANTPTETSTFEVRKGGTSGPLAATIYFHNTGSTNNPKGFFQNGGFYIKLNDNTQGGTTSSVGNYKPLSQAAIDLVAAGWVKVQPKAYLNGQPLNAVALSDAFEVKFTYPIYFNFADKYDIWDQGVGNNQRVTINTTGSSNVLVKDFLHNNIVFGTTTLGRTEDLINHYEIDYYTYGLLGATWAPDIKFDVAHVTTSLPNGQLPFGMKVKTDSSSPNGVQTFEWENASGGSVQNAFEIYVPVSLEHKWGILEDTITIVVNPGTGN